MSQKIAIIGGGAAGMMAAATLLEGGFSGEVHLFEKNNNLGAKVIISGGGRCNVTTGNYRWKDLESKYIRGAEFVREAIGQFGPRKIYQWFEDHGVPLKTEADMRVFPQSDNGKDIVGVFERLFYRYVNLRLHLGSKIDDIDHERDMFTVHTSGQNMTFDKIIIATGGNAYTHTGSTGDAYARAKKLGHTITPLGPSLNSFLSQDTWMHDLSGIAFPNAKLSLTLQTGEKKEIIGPMLFTHFGISGPATFVLSAYSSFEQIDKGHPLRISFSPDSEKTKEFWNSFLLIQAQENPRKKITTILHTSFPDRMIDGLNTNIFGGKLEGQMGLCSKELRMSLAEYFGGGWIISVIGRRAGDEFVTAGGVSLDEVNKKTMESNIVPGLYFVGEILNVDGVTGGYNLTSSWATGRLAGKYIVVS